MNTNNAVVILAKKPSKAVSKTRIAEEMTSDFAKDISIAILEDLINKIDNPFEYDLLVATDSRDDLSWFNSKFNIDGFSIPSNIDRSLSELIVYTFSFLFDNSYKKVLLIPMDMPFLDYDDLVSAFSYLDIINYVIGPENNGGIYMIGIRRSGFTKIIFKNVMWSTSRTFNSLVSNLCEEKFIIFEHRDDLNTLSDIEKCRTEIMNSCPKLNEFLRDEGYHFGNR